MKLHTLKPSKGLHSAFESRRKFDASLSPSGTIHILVSDEGFRKIRRAGLVEQGLDLVFKEKPVTAKTLTRVEKALETLDHAEKIRDLQLAGHAMSRLVGNIGQLEGILNNERFDVDSSDRADSSKLAFRALDRIADREDGVFGQRARNIRGNYICRQNLAMLARKKSDSSARRPFVFDESGGCSAEDD